MADSSVPWALDVLQYVLSCPFSLNMVPPTATVYGVDASMLTEAGWLACVAVFGLSHPAEPESPAATT